MTLAVLLEVRKIISLSIPPARSLFAVSIPSMPGISISRYIRSGCLCGSSSSNSSSFPLKYGSILSSIRCFPQMELKRSVYRRMFSLQTSQSAMFTGSLLEKFIRASLPPCPAAAGLSRWQSSPPAFSANRNKIHVPDNIPKESMN